MEELKLPLMTKNSSEMCFANSGKDFFFQESSTCIIIHALPIIFKSGDSTFIIALFLLNVASYILYV